MILCSTVSILRQHQRNLLQLRILQSQVYAGLSRWKRAHQSCDWASALSTVGLQRRGRAGKAQARPLRGRITVEGTVRPSQQRHMLGDLTPLTVFFCRFSLRWTRVTRRGGSDGEKRNLGVVICARPAIVVEWNKAGVGQTAVAEYSPSRVFDRVVLTEPAT